MYPSDTVTVQSDEQFAAEIIREKAFIHLKQELPYGVAVICRGWESSSKYETIFADIVVEKDSHKSIVLGKAGVMIQQIGTQARRELERIYGSKFVIKLFVRVEEDWTRSLGGLRKTGYDFSEIDPSYYKSLDLDESISNIEVSKE